MYQIPSYLALIIFVGTLPAAALELPTLSTVKLGSFDSGAAEMLDYDKDTKRVFATNSENNTISIIDISKPEAATLLKEIKLSEYGSSLTCVATKDGLVGVSMLGDAKQSPGKVIFFTTDGEFISAHETGALPDNLTFSPDGKYCVIANEGEPSDDYKTDPEGSISIVEIADGKPTGITTATFAGVTIPEGVRIFGPGASAAQDLEPEYVAISGDSQTAFVVCQENNAIAVVDLASKTVTALHALGTKDHSVTGSGFDASDKSDRVEIKLHPVKGMYLPDAMLSFDIGGKGYLITANEGDAREYDGFSEETRVEDLKLDAAKFPNAVELQAKEALGRLKTTTAFGDTDGDGDHDEIYSYGARSFSIWTEDLKLVFDSGDQFETITAEKLGNDFNSSNDEQDGFKNRSDDKGPEPEALALGEIDGKLYAFIGLERAGGIMIYDISDPVAPVFSGYSNNRNFKAAIDSPEAGDLAPEDLEFIPASDSPNGKNLLVTANEVSGTVTVHEVK